MKKDTVESRALKIAVKVLVAAGVCRYDSVEKCRRVFVTEETCDKCIKNWLISRARKELKSES